MKFKDRTLDQLADMICGNGTKDGEFFPYRSSSFITRFFRDCDTDFAHDGSTRGRWVADTLREILDEPSASQSVPSATFCRVIRELMDLGDGVEADTPERDGALSAINSALSREGFEAFYGDDKLCYLRNIETKGVAMPLANPHRPFSAKELAKKAQLIAFLDSASEDELIEEVLLPLFRQLGFHRITSAGHRDKALEYGKDIWMKFILPTQHVIYFGIQAKKGNLDSSGLTKSGNVNVAEIYNQLLMMIGHEIFDPEIGKKVLVDHAFIVAGGEITKAARNWLGGVLDASKRSQILFMDREDILNLFVTTNLPLPQKALPVKDFDLNDEIPF